MKRCRECKTDRAVSEFYRSRRSRDGLQDRCKPCQEDARRNLRAKRAETARAALAAIEGAEGPTGKRCPRCTETKPWADFQKLSSARDGKQVYCKPCGADIQREYKARHAERVALRAAEKMANAATTGTKTCTKCGETKPIVSFYLHRGTKDGRTTYCGPCQSASTRAWTAANAERVRRRNAEHLATKPAMHRRGARQWQLKLYGMTEADYAVLHESQDGVCAICLMPERYIDPRTGNPRRLAVDHDHATNQVRGLLCGRCNRSIGQFADDHERLDRAAAYLRKAAAMT